MAIETRFLLRLSLALLLASTACHATIVLVTLTRDAIYVGADGRVTLIDGLGNETPSGDVCKIRQFGNVVVAYSGAVNDPRSKFDVMEVFSSIKASSVSDFADKVAELLPAKFQAIAAKQTGMIPGDMAVVGFENGAPAFIRILFINENGTIRAVKKNDGKEFARSLKVNSGTIVGPTPIGKFNAMSSADFASLDCFTDADPEKTMRCYLSAYIKADPKHINQPIAIVKVTATQVAWLEKGKCCPK